MRETVTNIRLAGVGGQGILVASEILCKALLEVGYEVKKSEVHGMAQRGGTVNSDVRFGVKVYSPIIPQGKVDILLAFESLEALRYLPSLKPEGLVIVNEQRILPSTVTSGRSEYPSDIVKLLESRAGRVVSLDALALAREADSVRSVNICMLGALSCFLDINVKIWEAVLISKFADKGLDINLQAFRLGRERVAAKSF
jgi:indolepyruvate ferredoxin oxidoreductase beta subunit